MMYGCWHTRIMWWGRSLSFHGQLTSRWLVKSCMTRLPTSSQWLSNTGLKCQGSRDEPSQVTNRRGVASRWCGLWWQSKERPSVVLLPWSYPMPLSDWVLTLWCIEKALPAAPWPPAPNTNWPVWMRSNTLPDLVHSYSVFGFPAFYSALLFREEFFSPRWLQKDIRATPNRPCATLSGWVHSRGTKNPQIDCSDQIQWFLLTVPP